MKIINRLLTIAIVATCTIFFQGCIGSDDGTISEQDRFLQQLQQIDTYLTENEIEAEIDVLTGIRYVINNQGSGLIPLVVDSVTLSYTGQLLADESTFITETNQKMIWSSLLPGIRQALGKIQEGGSVTAYIPSYYAYGQTSTDNVPANSIIITEIDLHQIHAQQLMKDITAIDDSLAGWGIQAEEHPSGVRYVLEQGTGDQPTLANQVTVNYNGRLLGKETSFDSGLSRTFALNNLIIGWQAVLPLVQEGGSVTLYIPSSLGYGKNGSGSAIPANSNLVFDIDLLEVR